MKKKKPNIRLDCRGPSGGIAFHRGGCIPLARSDPEDHFQRHRDAGFRDRDEVRAGPGTDCELSPPVKTGFERRAGIANYRMENIHTPWLVVQYRNMDSAHGESPPRNAVGSSPPKNRQSHCERFARSTLLSEAICSHAVDWERDRPPWLAVRHREVDVGHGVLPPNNAAGSSPPTKKGRMENVASDFVLQVGNLSDEDPEDCGMGRGGPPWLALRLGEVDVGHGVLLWMQGVRSHSPSEGHEGGQSNLRKVAGMPVRNQETDVGWRSRRKRNRYKCLEQSERHGLSEEKKFAEDPRLGQTLGTPSFSLTANRTEGLCAKHLGAMHWTWLCSASCQVPRHLLGGPVGRALVERERGWIAQEKQYQCVFMTRQNRNIDKRTHEEILLISFQ